MPVSGEGSSEAWEPNMAIEERVDGRTTFGSSNQTQCGVAVNTASGSVSYFELLDTDGTTRYLWFDTSGNLRTGTSVPANPNTGGTVVGP